MLQMIFSILSLMFAIPPNSIDLLLITIIIINVSVAVIRSIKPAMFISYQ